MPEKTRELMGLSSDVVQHLVRVLDDDVASDLGDSFKTVKLLLVVARRLDERPKTLTEQLHVTLREIVFESLARILERLGDDTELTKENLRHVTDTLQTGFETVADDALTLETLELDAIADHPYAVELSNLAGLVLETGGHAERVRGRALAEVRARLLPQFVARVLELGAEGERAELVGHFRLQKAAGSARIARLEKFRARMASLDREPVFDEAIPLDEIYVPARAESLDSTDRTWSPCAQPLVDAVMGELDDNPAVFFVEGGPGAGKSCFCRMLAARVCRERRDLLPVRVPLRGSAIRPDGAHFLEIFEHALIHEGVRIDARFLRHNRCVFILDGFDELSIAAGESPDLRNFFYALEAFHERCESGGEWDHRVVVTGRPLAIGNPTRELPESFRRLRILPMSTEQQLAWLERWERLRGESAAESLERTLRDAGCFDDEPPDTPLAELATQPLLLYLLGRLDESGDLDEEIGAAARNTVFRRAVDRVCGRTGDDDSWRRLSADQQTALRAVLRAAGLAVFQSGGEDHVDLDRVRAMLGERRDALDLVERLGRSLLATFYFEESRPGGVEFTHRSFAEYLAAEAMAESLDTIAASSFDDETAARYCYATFGPRWMNRQVSDFLRQMLDDHEQRDALAARLRRIDDRLLDEDWLNLGVPARIRQSNPDVGIRTLDVNTHLSLQEVLGWLVADGALDESAPQFWWDENLGYHGPHRYEISRRIWLSKRDLRGSILVHAEFHGTRLRGANLRGSNLLGVFFDGCFLDGADLTGATVLPVTGVAWKRGVRSAGHGWIIASSCRGLRAVDTQITGLDVFGSDMDAAVFSAARIRESSWERSGLRATEFSGARLESVRMHDVTLRDADFTNAVLVDVVLDDVDLRGASFEGARLIRCDLTGARVDERALGAASIVDCQLP